MDRRLPGRKRVGGISDSSSKRTVVKQESDWGLYVRSQEFCPFILIGNSTGFRSSCFFAIANLLQLAASYGRPSKVQRGSDEPLRGSAEETGE